MMHQRSKKIIKLISILLILMGVTYGVYRVYRHYHPVQQPKKKTAFKPYKYNIAATDTSFRGYILLTPYELYNWDWGQLMIINTRGEIILDRQINGYAYEFKQWHVGNHVLYSYIYYDKSLANCKCGLAEGTVVILDSMLNEIRKVHLIHHDDVDTESRQGLNMHDFFLLSENHYFTLLHYVKQVKNIPDSIPHSDKTRLAVPIIQEVENDSVVWQWDASHFPEFYANSRHDNKYTDSVVPQDYMHMNAVWLDPKDSNLIVSFRNECQVIKVSRKTGGIIWRLGGPNSDFPLTPDETFLFQHNPTLVDSNNTLLVFDNGDSVSRRYSRILEFNLDEENRKVQSFRTFTIPKKFSMYMGSVEKYGDDYFICGGSTFYIMLINRLTGKKRFELKGNLSMYRAQHVDSIYGLDHVIKLKHMEP